MSMIPVDSAPPVVGRMPEALLDMLGLFQRMHRRHGPRFWSHVATLRVLTLMDPDDIAHVLRNDGDVFSNRDGWRLFLDHVFPGALLSMDGDEHRLQRRIMQQAFTNGALRDYVARMTPTLLSGAPRRTSQSPPRLDALWRRRAPVHWSTFRNPRNYPRPAPAAASSTLETHCRNSFSMGSGTDCKAGGWVAGVDDAGVRVM